MEVTQQGNNEPMIAWGDANNGGVRRTSDTWTVFAIHGEGKRQTEREVTPWRSDDHALDLAASYERTGWTVWLLDSDDSHTILDAASTRKLLNQCKGLEPLSRPTS